MTLGLIVKLYGALIICLGLASCVKKSDVRHEDNFSDPVKQQAVLLHEMREFHSTGSTSPLPTQLSSGNKSLTSLKLNTHNQTKELEARLSDIPVPLGVTPLEHLNESDESADHKVFGYSIAMSYDALVKFYQREMERLGWQQLAYVPGAESLLTFIKPERFCSVFLRPHVASTWWSGEQKTALLLFIGPRTV